MLTNAQLARELGVSPSTFSCVINHRPGVADETRQRVITGLRERGAEYLIKDPVSGRPGFLEKPGLCFAVFKKEGFPPGISASYMLIMEAIQQRALDLGYNLYYSILDDRRPHAQQIEDIRQMHVKGLLLYAAQMREKDYEKWAGLPCPVVCLEQDFSRTACTCVSGAAAAGAFQAISHLVRLGHRRIGYLRSSLRLPAYREREKGYRASLAGYGLSFAEEDIWTLAPPTGKAETDTADFLRLPAFRKVHLLPTAFVADEDSYALVAAEAFRHYGLRIPQDLSIIGFLGTAEAAAAPVPLTTVSLDPAVYADTALHTLLELSASPRNGAGPACGYRKIQIVPRLVQGGTTARCRREDGCCPVKGSLSGVSELTNISVSS